MRSLLKEEEKRKEKFLMKTLTSVQNGACRVQKSLAKEYHKPTLTEFLKPTETLLSSRIQKKYKTPTNAQKKKWCVPRWKVAFSTLTCEGSPGGNSLAVLYRRYCVELKVYG